MNKLANYVNNTLDIRAEYERIFQKKIPSGKMFCPFHNNVNTPAAKCYGNVIHCFVCDKSYTVYDLLSMYDSSYLKTINETVILADVVKESSHFVIANYDRLTPLKSFLDTIVKNNG